MTQEIEIGFQTFGGLVANTRRRRPGPCPPTVFWTKREIGLSPPNFLVVNRVRWINHWRTLIASRGSWPAKRCWTAGRRASRFRRGVLKSILNPAPQLFRFILRLGASTKRKSSVCGAR
jgi:hypothetical protein